MMLPQQSGLLEKSGLALALIYIVVQPLMLQNPIKPLFPGVFGKLQLADILFPAMLLWLCGWALHIRKRGLQTNIHSFTALFFLGLLFMLACLFSGFNSGNSVGMGSLAKYGYLIGLLFFFLAVAQTLSSVRTLLLVLGLCVTSVHALFSRNVCCCLCDRRVEQFCTC